MLYYTVSVHQYKQKKKATVYAKDCVPQDVDKIYANELIVINLYSSMHWHTQVTPSTNFQLKNSNFVSFVYKEHFVVVISIAKT